MQGACQGLAAYSNRLAPPSRLVVDIGRDAVIGFCQPGHNVGGIAA